MHGREAGVIAIVAIALVVVARALAISGEPPGSISAKPAAGRR